MEPAIYELPRDRQALEQVLRSRQTLLNPEELARVAAIFDDVRTRGDEAIREVTEKFDKIDLQFVDAKAGNSGDGDQAFTFIGSGTFNAEGQIRFFFEGSHTVVALNTIGTGGAEAQIELSGNISLSAADFVL